MTRHAFRTCAGTLVSLMAAVALAGCSEDLPPDAIRGAVNVDGSSTVFRITEATAEEFSLVERGIQVSVGVSGTGGGFERFCRGETDMNDASRPIELDEASACGAAGVEFMELPVAYDGLSVVVNNDNDFLDCITIEELSTIWGPEAEGRVTRWNQVRPDWPDEPITLYGAGTDSGTFEYFTEAVNGEAGASRTDFSPSEDDNVLVQGVAGDRYSLGYFGLAYLEANREMLKPVAVDGGNGCVLPSAETVANGTYVPLSRPLLIYVKASSAEQPAVRAFVDFYLANIGFMAADVGYVPLPEPTRQKVVQRWQERVTGTMFDDANAGQTLDERLDSEDP